jgi:4-carboxymuconolactone decarboxylase
MAHASLNMDVVSREIGAYSDATKALTAREQEYKDLVGFVPPRIAARLTVTGALNPELLRLQEEVRHHALNPTCFDTKTSQLMVFGILLAKLLDAAALHARAARRAGASWEEMQAVVSFSYLYGGLPSANRGAEIIAQLAESESKGEPAPQPGY